MNDTSEFRISVSPLVGEVSCILNFPKNANELLLLAHGAGAGMKHPFMQMLSQELYAQNIATIRYQFPYMEQGRNRPDKPEIAHQTIQAIYLEARKKYKGMPLFLGGKSYGGRMSSQAVANHLIEKPEGIVFYGFPLHAPGKVSPDRGDHLFKVDAPMLFCQGSKDIMADMGLIKGIAEKLGEKAELFIVEEGDHSFQVPKALKISKEKVIQDLAAKTKEWMATHQR